MKPNVEKVIQEISSSGNMYYDKLMVSHDANGHLRIGDTINYEGVKCIVVENICIHGFDPSFWRWIFNKSAFKSYVSVAKLLICKEQ